jgi:hypothetical protein
MWFRELGGSVRYHFRHTYLSVAVCETGVTTDGRVRDSDGEHTK